MEKVVCFSIRGSDIRNEEEISNQKSEILAGPSEHQGNVVGLLVGANPVIDRGGNNFADSCQGQMLILAHQLNEALLAKFAEVIFRLGNAIAVGDKNVALLHLHGSL